jgi:3'-5' exonuclease
MEIVIDIETIPDQSEGAIDRYMGDPVKCPHTNKADIGKSLGMEEKEYKFITVPDLKAMWVEKKGEAAVEEQAESKWLKTSFDGAYGQICCICIYVNGEYISFVGAEFEILANFWDRVDQILNNRIPFFIAHNAKFDLPFLFHRSVINGVQPAKGFNPHGRNGQGHYCTMESWSGFNNRIGLDRLAEVLGIDGKMEGMSGADVWPEYQKGNIARIAKYCKNDVEVTKNVYEKLNFKTI